MARRGVDNAAMIFTAHGLSVESSSDLDAKIVGLAEHSTGDPGECLLFQRALTFTPQDRELGMDTYAVSDRWGATSYGCVERYRITQHVLELDLTADGAQDLGLPQRVEIQLALSRETVDRLRTNLQDVLVGVPSP